MTQEELEKAINVHAEVSEWINQDKYGFSRTLEFVVDGEIYKIKWFCNESTLIYKSVYIPFHKVSTVKTMPINYKKAIQFYRNESDYPVCTIGLGGHYERLV